VCGRYTSTTPAAELASYFQVDEVLGRAPGPRWNVAPTDEVWLVAERERRRELRRARWGLVPAWAPTPAGGSPMINARAETVLERPAYRGAFTAGRRCLIPADGFYEWRAGQAWHLRGGDGRVLAFAGLWERRRAVDTADGAELVSCTILTTAAGEDVAPVHDRMPVVLPPPVWDPWLDPGHDEPAGLHTLLAPAPPGTLERVPVGPRVGDVANDDADLVEPVAVPSPIEGQLGLFPT
jgi:putative SOS response-associated peptidase YedK